MVSDYDCAKISQKDSVELSQLFPDSAHLLSALSTELTCGALASYVKKFSAEAFLEICLENIDIM